MALENILGIIESSELAHVEEVFSKRKALELFENNIVETYTIGTYEGLAKIHKYLFEESYAFAGKMRDENISKGNFRFAPMMYLETSL